MSATHSYPGELHSSRQVEVHRVLMVGIGGDYEPTLTQRQQIVLSHDPGHPLAIHHPSFCPQLFGNTSDSVASPMFEDDLLNSSPQFSFLFLGCLFSQAAIKPGAADLRQVTHPFHTEAALPRHYFPDFVVNAIPPRCWRRFSTFRKALLKKSTSRLFSASASFTFSNSRSVVALG